MVNYGVRMSGLRVLVQDVQYSYLCGVAVVWGVPRAGPFIEGQRLGLDPLLDRGMWGLEGAEIF